MEKIECIVSLSGGMDSATLLAYCLKKYGPTLAVSFDYGSKHNPYETTCSIFLCSHYEVERIPIDLRKVGIQLSSNLLLDGGEIPEGHYQSESMKLTVVPARNMIFLSILAGIADSRGIPRIAIGIHSGDHAIYPDCRPAFFIAMRNAIQLATETRVDVIAPFLHMDKTSILKEGLNLGVPFNLTRTCYKNQRLACGKCGACQERLEAFSNWKIKDPIEYEEQEEE